MLKTTHTLHFISVFIMFVVQYPMTMTTKQLTKLGKRIGKMQAAFDSIPESSNGEAEKAIRKIRKEAAAICESLKDVPV